MYEYMAKVTRVVDGDTVDLDIDLGMHVHINERCRLYGIDAPETYGVKKDSEEWEAGMKTKARLIELVEGKTVQIITLKDKQGKYGRYIVKLYLSREDMPLHPDLPPNVLESVNELLVREGLAEYKEY